VLKKVARVINLSEMFVIIVKLLFVYKFMQNAKEYC